MSHRQHRNRGFQRSQEATARQLDLAYADAPRLSAPPDGAPAGPGPVPLCVVCGRQPARFPLPLTVGSGVRLAHRRTAHPKLCLRCNHGVLRQHRMARANLRASLIVERDSELSNEDKYARLTHQRRRAQVAARHALDLF